MSKIDKIASVAAITVMMLVFSIPGYMMVVGPIKRFGMMVTPWYCDIYHVTSPMDVAWFVMGCMFFLMASTIGVQQASEVLKEN